MVSQGFTPGPPTEKMLGTSFGVKGVGQGITGGRQAEQGIGCRNGPVNQASGQELPPLPAGRLPAGQQGVGYGQGEQGVPFRA